MEKINIKKAKLIDRLTLEVEYEKITETQEGEEINKTTNEVSEKCRQLVHPDLIAAFDALIPHLPLMCELVDSIIFRPTDELLQPIITSYKVTGYSIGGHDEPEGVTLVGRKNLSNKRVLNLVAPFTKWNDEHNQYKYADHLKSLIANADYEILQYLFNGKVAPPVQTELNLAS